MAEGLRQLNEMERALAVQELLKCCGSRRWAERLAEARPFADEDALLHASDKIWWSLEPSDWLEAFSHHPKIGERKAHAQTVSDEARRWSEEEQAATRNTRKETLRELTAANMEYEHRFGFIYIVCASGKSTEEMLDILSERLTNDADKELRVAAEEQRRITHLRLKKLLER